MAKFHLSYLNFCLYSPYLICWYHFFKIITSKHSMKLKFRQIRTRLKRMLSGQAFKRGEESGSRQNNTEENTQRCHYNIYSTKSQKTTKRSAICLASTREYHGIFSHVAERYVLKWQATGAIANNFAEEWRFRVGWCLVVRVKWN